MIDIFDDFKKITKYDLKQYFKDFTSFVSYKSGDIVNFYNGGSLNEKSFFELDRLLTESNKITALFETYSDNFIYSGYWELLDKFTDSQSSLLTLKNMSKWSRSSRLNRFDSSLKLGRSIKQGETLESMANEIGFSNSQEDWNQIAVNNQMIEEEYSTQGSSKIVSISLQNNLSLNIPNIVDNFKGQNVLGKDMLQKITFENNDIKTVEYQKALEQSLYTILGTQKGSIPEFPDDGTSDEFIGTNANAIQYPALFRNMMNMFQKDGRWKEVNLIDIKREDDSVFMQLECKSVLNDSYITNVPV